MKKLVRIAFKEICFGVRRSMCWLFGHQFIVTRIDRGKETRTIHLYCTSCGTIGTLDIPNEQDNTSRR